MKNPKTIDELMGRNYPPTTYLVDRLIPSESLTILSGQSRSFKTYSLLDIAIAVASQKPLFDHFTTTQANVLIINEEDGERLLQQRFHQLGVNKNAGLPIHISALTDFKLEDKQIEATLAFCESNRISLIIIDSLIRVHSADENSAREVSKVFAQLRKFTKAGIAVLVTQHHRKGNQHSTGGASEMRGSSDILAAVDSHVAVTRKDTYYLTFTQEKQRYDVELEPFQVKVHIDNGSFRFEHLGAQAKPVDKATTLYTVVCDLLSEHGEVAKGELIKMIKEKGVKTYRQEMDDLFERWVAEKALPKPRVVNGNTHLYRLEVPNNE
ncbi:MAG TPA: AAA family ATPase [Candidatus Babeliaceae bacterium]|nr:AAA family ATPase [Candidatus Babeliaceae bacterium]